MFSRTGMSQQLSAKSQSIKMQCYKTTVWKRAVKNDRKGHGVNEGPGRERKRVGEGRYIWHVNRQMRWSCRRKGRKKMQRKKRITVFGAKGDLADLSLSFLTKHLWHSVQEGGQKLALNYQTKKDSNILNQCRSFKVKKV